jgi:hypothetical protein
MGIVVDKVVGWRMEELVARLVGRERQTEWQRGVQQEWNGDEGEVATLVDWQYGRERCSKEEQWAERGEEGTKSQ